MILQVSRWHHKSQCTGLCLLFSIPFPEEMTYSLGLHQESSRKDCHLQMYDPAYLPPGVCSLQHAGDMHVHMLLATILNPQQFIYLCIPFQSPTIFYRSLWSSFTQKGDILLSNIYSITAEHNYVQSRSQKWLKSYFIVSIQQQLAQFSHSRRTKFQQKYGRRGKKVLIKLIIGHQFLSLKN